MIKENDSFLTLKIAIIGDTDVGKSSIISRYLKPDDELSKDIKSTNGIAFNKTSIQIENYKILLDIRDISGKEKSESKICPLLKDINGCLIVYDITNETSFKNVENWNTLLQKNKLIIPTILVGNKCDLKNERKVSDVKGKEMAQKLLCPFNETSALTPTNINQIFNSIIQERLDSYKKEKEEYKKEEKEIENELNKKKALKLKFQKKYEDNGNCFC